MIFDRTWRTNRIECKIAGLRAKLQATKDLANRCEGNVPGALVIVLRDVPQQIAEMEERVKQLKAPNVIYTTSVV